MEYVIGLCATGAYVIMGVITFFIMNEIPDNKETSMGVKVAALLLTLILWPVKLGQFYRFIYV